MKPIADISEVLLELGLYNSAQTWERALAQTCLRRAEAAIRATLKYDPVYDTRTEYYPQIDMMRSGRDTVWDVNDTQAYERYLSQASTDELQVQHIPIRAVSDLRIDFDGRFGSQAGSFDSSTQKTEGTDFWPQYDGVDSSGNKICRDGIIRSRGRWPDTPGCVKITYTAGYTESELHGTDTKVDALAILESVVQEAVDRFQASKSKFKKNLAGFVGGPVTSESLGDYSYSVDSSLLAKIVASNTTVSARTRMRLQEGGFLRMDLGVI